MLKHKFGPGDRVIAMVDTLNQNARSGVYTIVKTLPDAGRGRQYRAKSSLDTHERVLDEHLLRPAND